MSHNTIEEYDLKPTTPKQADEHTRLLDNDEELVSDLSTVKCHGAIQQDLLPGWKVATNILKGNIGTGILGLPAAVKLAGIVVGPVAIGLVGIIAIHCMHLIIICSHLICKRHGMAVCDYGTIAEYAVLPYGRTKSRIARLCVDSFLIITQIGVCCVYVVFVSTNLHEVTELLTIPLWVAILFVPLLVIAQFRKLSAIAYFSMVANCLQVVGLSMIFIYCFSHLRSFSNLKLVGDIQDFPLLFGTVVFAFEGICMILPLENRMKHPDKMFIIMDVSMATVAFLYISLAFFGYAAFGNEIKSSITLNMPRSSVFVAALVVYTIAIFLSYFMQFYVPVEILTKRFTEDQWLNWKDRGLRLILVLLTCVLAATIPQLGNVISLTGAFSASGIALIFPALLHILCFWSEGLSRLELVKDIAIIIVGALGLIFGTWVSMAAIIHG